MLLFYSLETHLLSVKRCSNFHELGKFKWGMTLGLWKGGSTFQEITYTVLGVWNEWPQSKGNNFVEVCSFIGLWRITDSSPKTWWMTRNWIWPKTWDRVYTRSYSIGCNFKWKVEDWMKFGLTIMDLGHLSQELPVAYDSLPQEKIDHFPCREFESCFETLISWCTK